MVELTSLADSALQACYLLAVAEIGDVAQQVDLAIVAMGVGARELNYISGRRRGLHRRAAHV